MTNNPVELAQAQLKQELTHVSLELEAASAAARNAAEQLTNPADAWKHVQQLLTRFEEVKHRVAEFRRHVDELVTTDAGATALQMQQVSQAIERQAD